MSDEYNVQALSPAERKQLIVMLQEADAGSEGPESPAMEGAEVGNPDAEQDESLIRAICAEMMQPLIELVEDVIIGGMEQYVQVKQRLSEVQALKEKYSTDDYFPEDTQKWFSDATDGQDLFEKLHEDVSGFKDGAEDWNDELEAPKVKEIAGSLREKMMKLKGISPEAAAPVAVEATKIETPASNPKLDRVMRNIDALKKSGKNVGY